MCLLQPAKIGLPELSGEAATAKQKASAKARRMVGTMGSSTCQNQVFDGCQVRFYSQSANSEGFGFCLSTDTIAPKMETLRCQDFGKWHRVTALCSCLKKKQRKSTNSACVPTNRPFSQIFCESLSPQSEAESQPGKTAQQHLCLVPKHPAKVCSPCSNTL